MLPSAFSVTVEVGGAIAGAALASPADREVAAALSDGWPPVTGAAGD